MTVPSEVYKLVERFDDNLEAYKRGELNEEMVKNEFINPLFVHLGWDMYNERGNSGAYRDVIYEDSVKAGGGTKAPDYGFYVGGARKFFLEAKKPSVNIWGDIHPAFQLRRYAWSAKLPLSLLTDFEELAVYDGRLEPNKTDKASTARLGFFKYDQYADEFQWGKLYSLFSREAVLSGSLDKLAEPAGRRRGAQTVDGVFLKEIEGWREALALDLASHNDLNQRQLNYAVQMTIDRIIFLRMAEDRGIERYERLLALTDGNRVYDHLCDLFREADDRYNSGLFHFRPERGRAEEPDKLTPKLRISDAVLRNIIGGLYYPESPYEFGVLPLNVLGQVYERFLGKVIRLEDAGNRAVVEEKPEVRKAGGVYYTPTYIVDYIVEHTVGRLLQGKRPGPRGGVSKLKIVDPACGSGSFLVGAYQYLLDWHRDRYVEDGPEKHPKELHQGLGGRWMLTIDEKKRILLKNLYGVDIDPQAIEVTKLSLLLKVLEGESEQTLETQLRMFHERALPDLDNNIKCGNSLIGPDFYENEQMMLLDEEEHYRINVFDWKTAFPHVFEGDSPGFDAVIGNPPYAYVPSAPQQKYFAKHYKHQDYQKDLYLLFLERYERLLTREGIFGIIVSNTWLQSVLLRKIRRYLATRYRWQRILHLPDKVFKAVVDTHVLIFQKAAAAVGKNGTLVVDVRRGAETTHSHTLSWENIPVSGDPINIVAPIAHQELFRKIQNHSSPLLQICEVYNGVKPFEKGKGNPPQTTQITKEKPYVREGAAPDSTWLPLLRGSLIQRYANRWNGNYWISYGPWLAAPRDPSIFDAPLKIVVRQTGDSIIATLVERGYIARNNLHILLPKDEDHDLRYVLGVMNSRLVDFAYAFMNPEKGEALAEIKKYHVEQLPIHAIDFSDPDDVARHDRMVELVERMLALHEKLAAARISQEKSIIQRQIEATDRQIDRLVYELYELTEEEIEIVEDG